MATKKQIEQGLITKTVDYPIEADQDLRDYSEICKRLGKSVSLTYWELVKKFVEENRHVLG